ncbi:putative sporulation protein YtxC [Paenibacillus gansuensis]|uniref:Sporulation protein YtxC n=1 Tax=Paenibacillus gansuensis TaxID=306542 RepID=A0ABW5PET7_9BACL
MKLYTFRVTGGSEARISRLYEEMEREFAGVHNDLYELAIEEREGSAAAVHCKMAAEKTQHGERMSRLASRAVASFILDGYEEKLIRKIIVKENAYKARDEIAKIEHYTLHILNEDGEEGQGGPARNRRRKQIADSLHAYLEHHQDLNIDGFVFFRLQAYVEELREVVEYAIDEYLMEKQYQEFIALLKYFVYIQDAKIPVAHLMHKGENDFVLLNEALEPIETRQVETFVVEMIDKDINYEDMIVSTLITVSPHKVFIHTREPEMQVIKTIKQIFDDRASLCTLCSSCIPHLGGPRQDQLST